MESLFQDLQFAVRTLLRKPLFTLVALVTLALGIGATTAIFSVVYGVILQPLPFAQPDLLVRVGESNVAQNVQMGNTSAANLYDFRAGNRTLDDVAGYQWDSATLTGGAEAQELRLVEATVNLFDLLGVPAALGRTFIPEEGEEGNDKVLLLSFDLWQKRFGSDTSILGQELILDNEAYKVVGVMPPGLEMPTDEVEVWRPIVLRPDRGRFARRVSAIGRLQAGASLEQAQADLNTIAVQLAETNPRSNKGWTVELMPLREQIVGNSRTLLLILFGAVGVLLLLACANVANLLLVRASGRETELSIRSALGAERMRLVRQLLTESVILSMAGGLIGIWLAYLGLKVLLRMQGGWLPRAAEVAVNGPVLGFALVISLLTGLLFGLAPALHTSRVNLVDALRSGAGRSGSNHQSGQRTRMLLVVAEVGLALLLLVGAGLLTRSFISLLSVDPGFQPDRLITARIFLDRSDWQERQNIVRYFEQVTQRIEAIPGVESASAVNALPFSDVGINFDLAYQAEGHELLPMEEAPQADFRTVLPKYFSTAGIPLLEGRAIDEQDRQDTEKVVVINRTMAERLWPGESAIGKWLKIFFRGEMTYRVAGVVGDTRYYGLAEPPKPEMFMPLTQNPFGGLNVVLRTSGDPALQVEAVRRAILEVNPNQPAHSLAVVEDLIATSVQRERFAMVVLLVLASIAMVLAAIGLYGVLAYSVSRRTQEIGLRMALGASRLNVLRMVVGEGLRFTVSGLVVGLFAAFFLSRFLTSLLYGIPPHDFWTMLGVSVTLLVVAVLASAIPARRATRIDPVIALRQE